MDKLRIICVLLVFLYKCKCRPSSTDDDEFKGICQSEDIPNRKLDGVVTFQMKKPASPFIGRVTKLSELRLALMGDKPVVISGAKGVGKSELARKYAEEFVNEDENSSTVWIDSDSLDTFSFSFKDLSSYLGIDTNDKASSEIIREVFAYFGDRRALFIFDNAETDNYVINNLKRFAIRKPNNLHFIVTSRDRQWNTNTFTTVDLDVFTKEEGEEFLRRTTHADNEETQQLAKLLGYLPLALNKAAKYIVDEQAKRKYTLIDFTREYLDLSMKKYGSGNAFSIDETASPTESSKDVYAELGIYPTSITYITSVRPPTREETKEAVIDKIEKEAHRIEHQVVHVAKNTERKVRRFFKKLRNEVRG